MDILCDRYKSNLSKPVDLSIPLSFDGKRLNVFGAPQAAKHAVKAGKFIGDVKQGGSCNCEELHIIPHCQGTHTECVGHITGEDIYPHEVIQNSFSLSRLISITPEQANRTNESCGPKTDPGDHVITANSLQEKLDKNTDIQSLIIRTLPNDLSKKTRNYNKVMPPYFTHEAMDVIANTEIEHLLVDMPSVDRLDDGGFLSNHRIYWNMKEGKKNAAQSHKTITELIYVPETVQDGTYMLNLQIAAIESDAAPSRPVIYEVEPV